MLVWCANWWDFEHRLVGREGCEQGFESVHFFDDPWHVMHLQPTSTFDSGHQGPTLVSSSPSKYTISNPQIPEYVTLMRGQLQVFLARWRYPLAFLPHFFAADKTEMILDLTARFYEIHSSKYHRLTEIVP
jgi:hypothetical protein